MQGESVSILVFSLETEGEFVRLGVTELGSPDVIIGVVELLANYISGIGETRLSLSEKIES